MLKSLSYTDRVLSRRKPEKETKKSKRKTKTVPLTSKLNYDCFDLNKTVLPYTKKPLRKKDKKAIREQIEYTPPQYIGQNIYIRPSYIVSLPEFDKSSRFSSLDFQANQANLQNNEHAGILSTKAIGKMKNAINWMLCSADEKSVYSKKYNSFFKFKVNFITLTLPDTSKPVDNSTLQKLLLNPFLTYLRKYKGLKNYVWKLEFQGNGKLHVHFISDTFIHHAVLRSAWNRVLGSNKLLIDFKKKFNHENPNSTDIHSVRKIKNLAAYLAKYMTKNSADLAKIKGRIWGCNQELSKANKTSIFINRNELHLHMPCLMNSDIEYKKIESENPVTKLRKSFGEIFFIKYNDWFDTLKGAIKDEFDNTILYLKNIHATKDQLLTV
jgi:hypothetical protein